MTEAEWLACADPTPMLAFVRGKVSERKLRLFACACCRYFFCDPHGGDIDSETAILERMEWVADGLFGEEERQRAEEQAQNLDDYSLYALHRREALLAVAASSFAIEPVWSALERFVASQDCYGQELTSIGSRYLRDILGNPYQPGYGAHAQQFLYAITVVNVAQSIYDDRAFGQLPILADALEDAGCTDRAILDHCRLPGEHVRGCWVVDLVLGKE